MPHSWNDGSHWGLNEIDSWNKVIALILVGVFYAVATIGADGKKMEAEIS